MRSRVVTRCRLAFHLPTKLAGACLATVVLVSGCRKSEKTDNTAPIRPTPTNPPFSTVTGDKSTVRTVVNGLTGRTAVESARAAQQQIQAIHAKEQSALDEVLKDQ